MTFTVTTSKLERLVKRANTLESERYTPSSWRPLLPALEAAKATLRSTDLTQPQADAAATALAEAIIALHHRAGHS